MFGLRFRFYNTVNDIVPFNFQDTGKYCFGVEDTLKALEMGAVETLICWENLDIQVRSFIMCRGLLSAAFRMRIIC